MFFSVLIMCAAASVSDCAVFTDKLGPYKTEAECSSRLAEMYPLSIAAFRESYPEVGDVDVEGWCSPVDPIDAPEVELPTDGPEYSI